MRQARRFGGRIPGTIDHPIMQALVSEASNEMLNLVRNVEINIRIKDINFSKFFLNLDFLIKKEKVRSMPGKIKIIMSSIYLEFIP